MQGNEIRLSFLTNQLENSGAVFWKSDFAKRHKDDYMLDPVVITVGKAHIGVRAAAQNDGGATEANASGNSTVCNTSVTDPALPPPRASATSRK